MTKPNANWDSDRVLSNGLRLPTLQPSPADAGQNRETSATALTQDGDCLRDGLGDADALREQVKRLRLYVAELLAKNQSLRVRVHSAKHITKTTPQGSVSHGTPWAITDFVCMFARYSLSAGFLSAVADRFGGWGPLGSPGVAWGDMAHFLRYTHQLTSSFPNTVSNFCGWMATCAEVSLGLLLIVGLRVQLASGLSGLLLLIFGVAMVCGSGLKAPFDASVFAAASCAFLLAVRKPDRFTLDSWSTTRG